MQRGSVQRLYDAAQALPGDKLDAPFVVPVVGPAAPAVDLPPLRRRLGAFLRELAERLDPALLGALERAASAWDQVDSLVVVDDGLAALAAVLRADWERAGGPAALEALATLDVALALVGLLERRLATVVRLKVRSGDPALISSGRPFLDVAAALDEAARGWS
jgi:hypothetical protein